MLTFSLRSGVLGAASRCRGNKSPNRLSVTVMSQRHFAAVGSGTPSAGSAINATSDAASRAHLPLHLVGLQQQIRAADVRFKSQYASSLRAVRSKINSRKTLLAAWVAVTSSFMGGIFYSANDSRNRNETARISDLSGVDARSADANASSASASSTSGNA